MSATETIKPRRDAVASTTEKMQRLIDRAERDSLRRDFELLRERHGLPEKQLPKSPK